MRNYLITAGALLAALNVSAYDLSVEVGYGFGGTSSSGLWSGSPDTGFVVIKNDGSTAFVGELKLTALSLFGGDFSDTSGAGYSLAPGATWTLLPGPESSNYGGFGKNQAGTDPGGPPDDGVLLSIVGTADGCSIDFSIFDKDIHSGDPKTNPFGVTLDNYILQGGDPFGRDTFDDYEVAQTHAFFHVSGDCNGVPDTGSTAMLLAGGITAMAFLRRKLGA